MYETPSSDWTAVASAASRRSWPARSSCPRCPQGSPQFSQVRGAQRAALRYQRAGRTDPRLPDAPHLGAALGAALRGSNRLLAGSRRDGNQWNRTQRVSGRWLCSGCATEQPDSSQFALVSYSTLARLFKLFAPAAKAAPGWRQAHSTGQQEAAQSTHNRATKQ